MTDSLIHVAFADDHASLRKGVIAYINNLGGIKFVIEASDGKELLRKIEEASETPDVCLIDINMPEMNGFDTLLELKKKWPNIKVIVLTVFDLEPYVIKMLRYGANGYLLKSCDPTEIKTAITSVHHNGVYYADQVNPVFLHAIVSGQVKDISLTPMEVRVLKYCCTDLHFKQIAGKIGTSEDSVNGMRDSLFKKLNLHSRTGLAVFAIKAGYVPVQTDASRSKQHFQKKRR